MKKREVDHVLRAAGSIAGEKQFIIIGSQSLHGKYPDLPDSLVKSFEVDLMASKNADRTEWLNVIGVYSPFHEYRQRFWRAKGTRRSSGAPRHGERVNTY